MARLDSKILRRMDLFAALLCESGVQPRRSKILLKTFIDIVSDKCECAEDFKFCNREWIESKCEFYAHGYVHDMLLSQIEEQFTDAHIHFKRQLRRYGWIEVGSRFGYEAPIHCTFL